MSNALATSAALFLAGVSALALSYSQTLAATPEGAPGEDTIRALAAKTVARLPAVDPKMLVAMAWIESGFKPDAYRAEPQINDASVGLMQTLQRTARDMWSKGYKAYAYPDYVSLRNPEASMYFGAAYVDWLMKYHRQRHGRAATEQWIVESYNGGPGNSNAQTRNHWAKYQAARRRFG